VSTNIATQNFNIQIYFKFLFFFYDFRKIKARILSNPNYALARS